MKKTLFTFLLILIHGNIQVALAQNQRKVDSLISVLKTAKEDTNKAIVLNELGVELIKLTNFEDAKKYTDDALRLSEKLNYQKGISDAVSTSGSINWNQGDFDEAMKKFNIALKTKEKIGDKKGLAKIYSNIGLINMNQGKYKEAMENNLKALNLRREIKDNDVGSIFFNIAGVELTQGDYPSALKNYNEALKAFENTGDKRGIALTYMNIGHFYQLQNKTQEAIKNVLEGLKIANEIGNKKVAIACHNNLGYIYDDLHNYDEALKHYSECIAIAKTIGSKHEISAAYGNIGGIYFMQKNYDKALINYLAALKIAEEIGDKEFSSINYSNIGKNYLLQKKYTEAKSYLLKGYSIAKEIGAKERIVECLEGLAALEEELNHLRQSLDYHKLYTAYKDSLLNESSSMQLTEMETKYETEKKDKEILVLTKDGEIQNLEIKKQRLLKNSFIGGLALMGVLVFLGYRTYRTRQKLKLETLRNKIARDLHDDVGSTLSSIAIFTDIARQQTNEVTPMLEQIGDSSRKMLDAMADIVWTINPDNDQFEKIILRMRSFAYELLGAKKIDFEFNADENVSKLKLPMDVRKNLYLIFKEATNNMMKYAEANKASFSISGTKENLTMLIRDNGKGFDINKLTQGNGLKNMKRRAEEIGARLLIESELGKGTTVQILLNLA